MVVEVGGACFQLVQSASLPLPPRSQTMASVFSTLSSSTDIHALHHPPHRSSVLRSRSLDLIAGGNKTRRDQTLTRAGSAGFDGFFDDDEDDDGDFVRRLRELATRMHQASTEDPEIIPDSRENINAPISNSNKANDASPSPSPSQSFSSFSQPPWPAIRPEPPVLPDLVQANVERKANSVDLPMSLRMIKRKKKTSSLETTPTGSPVKKAFSSMVFMIGELQRCTLQMRELLFVESMDGILARVQTEMHASFVWLFQQIFSCTPSLMLSLMLILANFTVSSMAHSTTAFAAAAAPPPPTTHSSISTSESKFDTSATLSFSIDGGKTASVGGGAGGGGKARPVAGDTDGGDGRITSSSYHGRSISSPDTVTISVDDEEETNLWNMIVDEGERMKAESRHEALMDVETLVRFVSPITVEVTPEDESPYLQTELMYHDALSQDPNNAVLLCNFAQFLFLVLRDNDRAEYYFKRAVETQPDDAEALSKYAGFLWQGRNDIGGAEEAFLEAIAADPSNSFYAANYAHFLWSTGGEDTCYPLD